MRRLLCSLALGVTLLAPMSVVVRADDHPRHEWNDGENNAWHQYLKEHHRKDHDWTKASRRERSAYWRWRDQHRDIH
jgi:hypothetical protein